MSPPYIIDLDSKSEQHFSTSCLAILTNSRKGKKGCIIGGGEENANEAGSGDDRGFGVGGTLSEAIRKYAGPAFCV